MLSIRFIQRKQVCIFIERMHASVFSCAILRSLFLVRIYARVFIAHFIEQRQICVLSSESTFSFHRPKARLQSIVRMHVCVRSCECMFAFLSSDCPFSLRFIQRKQVCIFFFRMVRSRFYRANERLRFLVRTRVCVSSSKCTFAIHLSNSSSRFYHANTLSRSIERTHNCVLSSGGTIAFLSIKCKFTFNFAQARSRSVE